MQMQLGFVEDDPAARAALAAVERPSQIDSQPRGSASVRRRRSGLREQLAIDDFADLVLGHAEEIGVGRPALHGAHHRLSLACARGARRDILSL
jgi:hypothetical protein